MPYVDPVKRRKYQLAWAIKRRKEWIKNNGPCNLCGSNFRLEVDHVDRQSKVSHRVWSWKESRRIEELSKCQVLCYSCHKKKHAAPHGAFRRYKSGCRCDLCRSANRDHTREARRRRELKEPGWRNKRPLRIPE